MIRGLDGSRFDEYIGALSTFWQDTPGGMISERCLTPAKPGKTGRTDSAD